MNRFTTKQRITIGITGIILLAMISLAFLYYKEPRAVEQQSDTVTAGPAQSFAKEVKISRTGLVEHATAVPVRADFSGTIIETYVTAGQNVKAGQPLYKINGTAIKMVQQSSEMSAATAPAPEQQPPAAPRRRSMTLRPAATAKDLAKYQQLYDIGAISRKQFEAATAAITTVDDTSTETSETTVSPESANAASAPSQPAATVAVPAETTILAPTDGILTNLTSSGTSVQAGQELCTLGSGQSVEIVIPLNQEDLYLVHLGTPVMIQYENQTVAGQVSRIYPQIGGDQTVTFKAHVLVSENPGDILQPGIQANVFIGIGATMPVPAVPTTAIAADFAGNKFIYFIVDGKAVKQAVTTGEIKDGLIEITSQLPDDAVIITNGLDQISNGKAVTITDS